jgi:hypothetical protein
VGTRGRRSRTGTCPEPRRAGPNGAPRPRHGRAQAADSRAEHGLVDSPTAQKVTECRRVSAGQMSRGVNVDIRVLPRHREHLIGPWPTDVTPMMIIPESQAPHRRGTRGGRARKPSATLYDPLGSRQGCQAPRILRTAGSGAGCENGRPNAYGNRRRESNPSSSTQRSSSSTASTGRRAPLTSGR